MWVVPTVVILAGMVILDGLRHCVTHFHEIAGYAIPLLIAGTAIGLLVAWRQQSRPWLSEAAGLAAAACWCLCAVAANEHFRLQSADTIIFTSLLGLAWVPWVLRQRILVGAEMAVCCIPIYDCLGKYALSLSTGAVAYGCWMLAERLRENKGLYAGYDWVGVPACFGFLLSLQVFTCEELNSPHFHTLLHEHAYAPAVAAGVMIALLLLLRPRVSGRAWLAVVAAAVLPTLAAALWANHSTQGIVPRLLALPCPVALLWVAVTQRRREWVFACTLNLFIWCNSHAFLHKLLREDSVLITRWLIGFILIALSFLLYRKARTAS